MSHKSGFVNIIGKPNAGKSTLVNALVGENMSIINSKPQTTRHRIFSILNEEGFQIVFSDTPGLIQRPAYKMQDKMNRFAYSTFEDADIFLVVTDGGTPEEIPPKALKKLKGAEVPIILVVNKADTLTDSETEESIFAWEKEITFKKVLVISALHKINTGLVLNAILKQLPEGPAYYPKDQLTDKPERFFISEIIRNQILNLYHQEIPYSTEVIVTAYKEAENKDLIKIAAEIIVDRKSQKPIIIGKGGKGIKKLGTESRKEIEAFLERHVYLELFVKVKDNWRDDERFLKQFGYNH
ncbi:MAG: GTPase Era [Saprospirales bacterium]|nr:MAG: GTPase Era [Saprospirales bacterium]